MDAAEQTTNKGEEARCLEEFTVHRFVICNVHWLQGKHMIGRGVKYFDEGIRGTIVFSTQKTNTESLSLTD